MTAIISRSQESATQATPAARERTQDRRPAAVLPINAYPGVGTQPEVNWLPSARAALAVIASLLADIEEPPEGWTPCDTPCELITIVACRLHNLPDDEGSEAWQSRTDLLHELVWPRESLRAAVELGVSRGWSLTTPGAFGHLMAATNKLGALCAALEEPNDVARQLQFAAICSGQDHATAPPSAAAKPFSDPPRPPIRREPAASVDDSQRVFNELAQHASTLRDFLLDARRDVESTGDKRKAANNFLMAEYLCTFMGSVCDQMVNYGIAGGPAEWAINRSIQTEGGAA
ncbi:hypothetical protein [Paracidovorax konjaci]|uniref:Uncharacterized protein n=1 Tax=Paracidovorax konjaci TaxID=32040 RepID=A0A1I1YJ24_9BURK|nr:hypothetical protein [Paracidovorax konjaci]SFE19595.1 hypothetical protein SAMN04489710_11844 [Paracidovorax konjaci]